MDTKHTATPWPEFKEGADSAYSAEFRFKESTSPDMHSLVEMTLDDYSHARTCVNAHDDLVKALQAVRQMIDGSQPKDLAGALMVINHNLAKAGAQ